MTSIERWPWSYLLRAIILIGVIACLCFSVGEGLRLTPFPVSAHGEAKATDTDTECNTTASYETSLRKYGPLDVPTRVQKRGKRQTVDYGYAPSHANRASATYQVVLTNDGEPVHIVSLLFRSRVTGRAPPSIS